MTLLRVAPQLTTKALEVFQGSRTVVRPLFVKSYYLLSLTIIVDTLKWNMLATRWSNTCFWEVDTLVRGFTNPSCGITHLVRLTPSTEAFSSFPTTLHAVS